MEFEGLPDVERPVVPNALVPGHKLRRQADFERMQHALERDGKVEVRGVDGFARAVVPEG